MRRVLIVANESLGGAALRERLALKRSTDLDLEVFVLVPAVEGRGQVEALAGAAVRGGAVAGRGAPEQVGAQVDDASLAGAARRLDIELSALRALHYNVRGAVGGSDVVAAVRSLLNEQRFDEIILITLPSGGSRWLRMDLPHRLERVTKLPVDHVIGEVPSSAEETQVAQVQFPGVRAAQIAGPVRILLVEDNDEDAELTRLALQRCSTRNSVETVENGAAAIERLRPADVDLVLVDLKMPVVDGFQLLETLRRQHDLDRLAVVVLTNSDRMEDRQRAHDLGAHAYITKEAVFPLYLDVLDGVLAEVAPRS
jgi:CheY-like chemotaxis protein